VLNKLDARWFVTCDGTPEDKQRIEEVVRNSSLVREILTAIFENKRKALENPQIIEDYKNPNWALVQADRNGALRIVKEILELTRI
jgi:hypothetical protein